MLTELQRERIYPYAGGAIAFAWVISLSKFGYVVAYNEEMLAALVSLGGIFAGFLATLKTLLAAMGPAKLNRLKVSGYMGDLAIYLREGIWSALLLCMSSMFGFANAIRYPTLHAALLFGLLFFAILALYRITKIGMNLLSIR